MNIYEKFIDLVPKFYADTVVEENFSETVLALSAEFIPLKEAYVFFINSDNLSLKYSYKSKLNEVVLSFDEFSKKFSKDNVFVTDLFIEQFPFAKFVLVSDSILTPQERKVCSAIASVAANRIKDMELTSVLKMQVEALQEGMDEVNNMYKVIKAQNRKILNSDKIKNEFLANVSHQLRSPLNSIIGFSDMLSLGVAGSLTENQKEYINDIKISGIKLLEMINEILDISKLEAKSMQLFPKNFRLKLNVGEVLNILKPLLLEKNISVDLNIDDNFEICADYQKLQQVFFNLISNAVKFVPVGGRIEISAVQKDNNYVLSVKDNGIGIPPKYHKKIFQKFVQVSSQHSPSTGLGLTIVQKIVSLHNGKIKVVSQIGKGAEFIITIPLS